MDNFSSLLTVVAVLAAIFVPQALVIYFSGWNKAAREEYIPDGR